MNTGRTAATAVALSNGKVLIVGGNTINLIQYQIPFASTELYDEASNTFAAISPPMNYARISPATVVLNSGPNAGDVLILCGNVSTANPQSAWTATELYNPATNSFAPPTETPNLNVAREFCIATMLNSGKVLVAGGGPILGNPIDSTEIYDPETNTFTLGPDMDFAPNGVYQDGFASPGTTATLLR